MMLPFMCVLCMSSFRPCRVGSVDSVSASCTVGREFASRPGHTKDQHKNGTNCLPALQLVAVSSLFMRFLLMIMPPFHCVDRKDVTAAAAAARDREAKLTECIQQFVLSTSSSVHEFPTSLSSCDRYLIHEVSNLIT